MSYDKQELILTIQI